jgi:hypothetical protein
MRKVIITLFAVTFLTGFTGVVYSEEKAAMDHKGDKGISFSVSGLSYVGIGQFEGGIGGKYWISGKTALVSSVSFSVSRTTTTPSQQNYTDYKSSYDRFSIFAGMENHFFAKKKLSPYLGIGLRYAASSSVTDFSLPKENPYSGAIKKEETTAFNFGVWGSCGIEYFFADWVSLAGQYHVDYYYEKSTLKRVLVEGSYITQPADRKNTKTTLGLGTSSLVATFYIW